MSLRALTLGVEKRLRSAAVFNDQPEQAVGKFVGVQPAPGRPPANFGQWYLAVWFGGGRGTDRLPERLDEMLAVVVTLTYRLNYAPRDRQAKQMADAGVTGMYKVADAVVDAIHGKWATVDAMNSFIEGSGTTANGFTETLVLDAIGTERRVGADWLPGDTADVYALDVRFKDARRIQGIY